MVASTLLAGLLVQASHSPLSIPEGQKMFNAYSLMAVIQLAGAIKQQKLPKDRVRQEFELLM